MIRIPLASLAVAVAVSCLMSGCGTGTIDGGTTAAGSGSPMPSSGAAGAAPSPNVGGPVQRPLRPDGPLSKRSSGPGAIEAGASSLDRLRQPSRQGLIA